MFINDIPEAERGKAVLLSADARLIEAAAALSSGADIVVILVSCKVSSQKRTWSSK